MLKQFDHDSGRRKIEVHSQSGKFASPTAAPELLRAARRQSLIVILSVFVAFMGAIFYLIQAVPSYTSNVSILIDSQKASLTTSSPVETSLTFDAGSVDSQVQLIESDRLATLVVTQLGLQNNFAFLKPRRSWLRRTAASTVHGVYSFFESFTGSGKEFVEIEALPEEARVRLAAEILKTNLYASRVGRTYVLNIEYTDSDPSLAKAIVGQYANAYLDDQLKSKSEVVKRTAGWMQDSIADLREKAIAAGAAAERFRAEHDLTEADGRLIDDQSLRDATAQLAAAREELDTARARFQRMEEIINSKNYTSSVTDSIGDPNIAQLRSKYLQAAKKAGEFALKYGEDHQATINARKDMDQYQGLIFGQLSNLYQNYKSDMAIAKAKVNIIEQNLEQLRKKSASSSEARIRLSALDQEADAFKSLYVNSLQKLEETQQQESFPVTDARIISQASTPILPSSPNKPVVFAISVLLGGFFGAGLGAVREWRDRGFRTASQIRNELGLEFIANIPSLPKKDAVRRAGKARTVRSGSKPASRKEGLMTVQSKTGALEHVMDQPFSQFSESMRAIRLAVSNEFSKERTPVIGLVSLFPEEGKSTVAKNLASSYALHGSRAILIDGDLRNPSLTRDLANDASAGLVELASGHVSVEGAMFLEESSGMRFIAGNVRQLDAKMNDLFGMQQMHGLIDRLRADEDIVIIDFPPVGALADALLADPIVDGYVFVAEWGKTPRGAVREFVIGNPNFADKIIGVVLNKVDLKGVKNYDLNYYNKSGGKYYKKYFYN